MWNKTQPFVTSSDLTSTLPPAFHPPYLLRSPHIQTIAPHFFPEKKLFTYRKHLFTLSDGDCLECGWIGPSKGAITIVLHGLGGSINSPYIISLLNHFYKNNQRVFFIHFRCCGEKPNRLERLYHAGDSQDIAEVVEWIHTTNPHENLYGVGFSLGANVLAKYLGERGNRCLLKAATMISTPFDIQACSYQSTMGLTSRLYYKYLIAVSKQLITKKFKNKPLPKSIQNTKLNNIHTLYEFDEQITAPLHAFKNANDYYKKTSSIYYIKDITIPTLFIQAKDDPIIPESSLPQKEDFSNTATLELHRYGGHNGFINLQSIGSSISYHYLNTRILQYLLHISDVNITAPTNTYV